MSKQLSPPKQKTNRVYSGEENTNNQKENLTPGRRCIEEKRAQNDPKGPINTGCRSEGEVESNPGVNS